MIRFQMMGTVDLKDAQGREISAVLRRPKLLALLGYLAAARPRSFHRRDILVALLWPDLDSPHARNALRQAVHSLRDAMGHEAVLARGEEELGLNEQVVWCDVRDFLGGLDAGRAEEALGLYHGALLHGLHVSEVPEFERWLDAEREHLRRRASDAAQALTTETESAGNGTGAARWALRWTELSPFDETAVRRLIQVLDRAGDRAGAVRAYEEFQRRLGRDLEVEPSSETAQLVDGIRARQLEKAAPIATRDPAPISVVRRTAVRTRRLAVLTVVVAGALLGGWVLFRFAHPAETSGAPKRIVVLPFVNLGPADEQYLADGITEELAARLAAIDRFRVIGSTTANSYKGTNKAIPDIARELDVDFVLEGSVRWQKSSEGPVRVRVTPQLISTTDGTHLWAQVYDEPMDEVFRVESEIAQRVATALDIMLLDRQRRAVNDTPTVNLQAYDYYLRGNDYARRALGETSFRAAIQMYAKAVELDPRFARAYARLSRMHSRLRWGNFDFSEERLVLAKQAVDKALELAPDLADAHQSLGVYYMALFDFEQALREFDKGEERRPSDNTVFTPRAVVLARMGRIPEAVAQYELAQQLDPASSEIASNYGIAYDFQRDYPHAEVMYDRAIALAPDRPQPYTLKVWLYVRQDGTTQRARRMFERARTAGADKAPGVLYARILMEFYDRNYQKVLELLRTEAPELALSDHLRFVPRAQLYAQTYAKIGRHELARAYYDSARSAIATRIKGASMDARLHTALGIAYAGLGQKREALAEADSASRIMPISKDAYRGYHTAWEVARIFTAVGEYDRAIDILEHLLVIPGQMTPGQLRVDPVWDPLLDQPRYRRLLEGEK